MVYKKITIKDIREVCEWLEFYDKYGILPFEKKRISITLSGKSISKLKEIKNKSEYIDRLVIG